MTKIPNFKSKDIADLSKKGGIFKVGYNLIGLVSLIIVLIIVGIFLFFIGVPVYVVLPFTLIPIFICMIGIIIHITGLIQLSSTNVNAKSIENKNSNNIKLKSDEKIVGYIAGVMRTASGLKIRAVPFPAVGEVRNPENTIIITNRSILFIVVPLPGADKNLAGFDIPMMEWLTAKKDIEAKLKEMLSSLPLNQIFQSNPRNFLLSFDEIQNIKINEIRYQAIDIITKNGKLYRYSIRDKAEFNKAKNLFQNFLHGSNES